ncbi:TBC1 domain family member 30 [Melipona quadrifasciata]|uniref:TBC1 domain family member 30 n=1 Tax=Melipona quadrifasciata TaxID=166423 RepID=A0A0M8ZSA4_9HYME|nr:TBC1 domain family member 30 [Melipona quadrifasciata]
MIEENKKRGDSGIILNIWLEKTSDRSPWRSTARPWKNQTIDESVPEPPEHVPPQYDVVVRGVQLAEIGEAFPRPSAERGDVVAVEQQRFQAAQFGERAVLYLGDAVVPQVQVGQLVQIGEIVSGNRGQLVVANVQGGRVADFEKSVLGYVDDPEALQMQLYVLDRLNRVDILERDAVQHAVGQADEKELPPTQVENKIEIEITAKEKKNSRRKRNLIHRSWKGPDFMELNRKKQVRRASCVPDKVEGKCLKRSKSVGDAWDVTESDCKNTNNVEDKSDIYRPKTYPSPLPNPPEKKKGAVSSLVDQLLLEIYGMPDGDRRRSDSDSTASSLRIRPQHQHLQKARLLWKSEHELRVLVLNLRDHINHTGEILVRQLRRKDYLTTKCEKLCAIITAHLQAVSQKRETDSQWSHISPNVEIFLILTVSLAASPSSNGLFSIIDSKWMTRDKNASRTTEGSQSVAGEHGPVKMSVRPTNDESRERLKGGCTACNDNNNNNNNNDDNDDKSRLR